MKQGNVIVTQLNGRVPEEAAVNWKWKRIRMLNSNCQW